jgi:DeoR family fructose operon transcriptional repressor
VPASALALLETAVVERDRARAPEKDRIGQAALGLLPPGGGSVLLDAGTTTSRLANLLTADQPLTVVTNAVPIASRLAPTTGLELHLLPGRVRRTTQAAVGEDTVAALARLRVDVAFVGANGISFDHGLSTPDHSEAATKQAMVRAAHKVVVLADSSKLGHEHAVRFAELADVDTLVTDDGITDADLKQLEDLGVEVVVA